MSYSVPLFAGNSERNHNLSVLLSDNKKSLNLQNRPIAATGLGYVFRAEHDKIDKFDLDVKFKHSSRDYGLKVSQANHYTSTELSAAGSVTWINDTLLTGQRIDQAFAFVTIPNFNHVGVYHDNRLIGYTNQQGHLIVPRLRPYQKNTLRIKLQDLPFDTTISKTQQIVAPNYRHGVIVKFDAKKSFGAKMTIKQHNGEFVPVGAVIYQPQSQASFVVGLNGLAYITDISPQPQPFMVLWPNNRCQVLVGGKPNNQYLTDLGELVCESVKP